MRFPLLGLGLATGALGLAACTPDDAPPPVTPPVYEGAATFLDDGAASPGFTAFRDSVRAIVARRDTVALLRTVAPNAKLSYDEAPGGPRGLRALWFSADASPPEPIWTVLDRILSAGSVEEDDAFTVPYVAGLWPEDLDPFAHVAAFGDSTIVLDLPDGTEIARLAGVQILPLADPTRRDTWHVVLPDGSNGHIPRTSAVSPVGYRATFWKVDGDWKLHVFVSGE